MKKQILGHILENDRTNWISAKEFFEKTFHDPIVCKQCIAYIADSIRAAHSCGPLCWSITLFDKKIRLDVGQVEVLTLYQDGLRLIISTPLFINNQIIDNTNEPYYKAVPVSSNVIDIDISESVLIPDEIRKAHLEYISCAAKLKNKSPWKKAFSPGVIEYIERSLNCELPIPLYYIIDGKGNHLPEEIIDCGGITEGAKNEHNS